MILESQRGTGATTQGHSMLNGLLKWRIALLKNLSTILALIVVLSSCEPASKEIQLTAKFSTAKACVLRFNEQAGPLKILKDKPKVVWGETALGTNFMCTRRESGLSGTYWDGVLWLPAE
jgi:hypothetical protein